MANLDLHTASRNSNVGYPALFSLPTCVRQEQNSPCDKEAGFLARPCRDSLYPSHLIAWVPRSFILALDRGSYRPF